MKYFLHDTSALDDEKISELYIEFGYEGTGLFFAILEKMAKQEKPIKTVVLKKQLDVGKKLEKIWLFMEKIELIHSTNGETFNKQLLNFSESYKIKNEKTKKRVSEWREKQSVTENVTDNKQVRNAPKVKKSKVNESNNTSLFPEAKASGSVYTQCIGIYNQFILKQTGFKAPIGKKEGASMKEIIEKFDGHYEEHPELKNENGVPFGFAALLANYDKWEPFYKKNIKLEAINTNLINIFNYFNNLRNDKSKQSTKQQSIYTPSR